ncbi:surface lipoprotein assembly modifier [Methylobacillus sp. Pita1]|uniref:surface lipoprotein assembly modifier n=1 Tax=Methylobacillus sp. Pita1 TaxID=3382642 RepID=UPI0038B5A17C
MAGSKAVLLYRAAFHGMVGAALLLMGGAAACGQDADLLVKAGSLIAGRDYAAAYALLEPVESEHSGDPAYDMLFGLAAIDSGHVTRGVFALERVLAVQPDNANARAQIARAYFLLGEQEAARAEFRNVLDRQPPEDMARVINRYMSAIDKAQGLATTFSAYLEGTLGHDSNVNSATTASSVAVPGIANNLDLVLSRASRASSDNFMTVAGGMSMSTPLTSRLSVFAGANGSQRLNHDEHAFDIGSLDVNAGLRYRRFVDTFTLAVQDANIWVDDQRFRRAYGLNTQWQHDVDNKNQLSLFAQLVRISYPENEIRDANRYVAGAGWAHVFSGDKTPVLFTSVYMGREKVRSSGYDFLSNDLRGARVGGQLTLTPAVVAYGALSYEHRHHDAQDPFFLKTRQDNQFDISMGLRYLPGSDWVIRPQLSYIRNQSNTQINDFDRYMFSVSVRHDFNW